MRNFKLWVATHSGLIGLILAVPLAIAITCGFNFIKTVPDRVASQFQRGTTDEEIREVLKITGKHEYRRGIYDCRHYAARFWKEMHQRGVRVDYVSNSPMNHAYNRVKLQDGSYIFVEPQAFTHGERDGYLVTDCFDIVPELKGLSSLEWALGGFDESLDGLVILSHPPKSVGY